MLGHKAVTYFSNDFDVYVTFRDFNERLKNTGIFNEQKVIGDIDAFAPEGIKKLVGDLRPDYVLNCIGIIKQLKEANNPKTSIHINSLFPHLLAEICSEYGAKLLHISTDCVFSGKKGDYTEQDQSDAEDLYGRSKFLGEVGYDRHLTLRTSIIGHELFTQYGLLEWFLSQEGKSVNGFTNAIYTGFTTDALCAEIKRVLTQFPELSGVYEVSSEKINKFDLILLIKEVYGANINVTPYKEFYCDRSLNSAKYRAETGFLPPTWKEMILEMYNNRILIKA